MSIGNWIYIISAIFVFGCGVMMAREEDYTPDNGVFICAAAFVPYFNIILLCILGILIISWRDFFPKLKLCKHEWSKWGTPRLVMCDPDDVGHYVRYKNCFHCSTIKKERCNPCQL